MVNRKSKSTGQSQPKHTSGGGGGGGGASKAPKASPQPKPKPPANPTSGNASSKPPSSSSGGRFPSQVSSGQATAPKPAQPQVSAQRPSNGPKHPTQGSGGGANASNSSSLRAAVTQTSGHGPGARASHDRSLSNTTTSPPANKRNEGGVNNSLSILQNTNVNVHGRPAKPNTNISSKNEASKSKSSQGFFGGLFSTSNAAEPAPNRHTNAQQSHVPAPKAHGATKKVSQDPSPTSKQSANAHAQPPARNTQSHHDVPTVPKKPTFVSASSGQQQQQPHAGKSTNTTTDTLFKVQVGKETHTKQRDTSHGSGGGGQYSAPPAQASAKTSDKSQQQHHKVPQGNKDTPPSKSSADQGNRLTERKFVSTVFSLFSADETEATGNPSNKSKASPSPPSSRPAKETSDKGHKDSKAPQGPRPQVKERPQSESSRDERVLSTPKVSFSPSANGIGNKSQSVNAAKSPGSTLNPGIISTGAMDFFAPAAKKEGAHLAKGPGSTAAANSALNLNAAAKPPMKDRDRPQGKSRTESALPTAKVSSSNHISAENGTWLSHMRSAKVVDPPKSTLNPVIISGGNTPSPAARKQGPSVAKTPASANVPKAAAAPEKNQTWGEMFSSWIFPSAAAAPVVVPESKKSNSSSLAKQHKAKDPGPRMEPRNTIKADTGRTGRARFDPPQDLTIILREPVPSAKGSKNGLQEPSHRLNSDILSSKASSKKEQPPSRHNVQAQTNADPRLSSSGAVPENHKTATTSTSALSHAQMSSKPQSADLQSPSKDIVASVISPDVRKDLLRQRAPTLRWRESDTPKIVSAYSTLTAAPLPSPPENELRNKVARKTIARNPDLFKVVTPIKADVFEEYTKDHPNQPFVQSVARSLKDGFWPWADTSDPTFPTTHDGSRQGSRITREDKAAFIQGQRDEEMQLERWSKPFGEKLLPGMHSAPINVVPKSTPGKFRLIVDQSRGPHSLNSTIEKKQVNPKLDSIHDLGNELLAARKKYPDKKILLFKSDVKSAYRQLPMHPLWQIKQAIPIDGQYHIDRCNTFGNRGGGWNWDSLSSSVNWIATEKKGVSGLLGYVDDNFGWELEGNKKFYKPYNKSLPAKQARLLELWDELGIPHDEEKQLSGPSLPILGYQVDAKAMNVKVTDEKKAKVVNLLRSNAHEGKKYTVNELESVAGSVGSALNLYPQLRPGLRVLFDEMAAQKPGTTKLTVTKPVARSLSALADFLERAPPIPIRHQKERVRAIGTGKE